MLCAVEAERSRVRRWPVALLLPILLVWGCAHGSFTFGYGLLGLYVLLGAVWRRAAVAPPRQLTAIAATTAVAAVLTAIYGPLGIANFTHGEKVAGSALFRTVAEWTPPFHEAAFPPAWPFWAILAATAASLGVSALLAGSDGRPARPSKAGAPPARAASPDDAVHVGPFDVAAVLLALGMALWARRFAPIFYLLAAPVVLAAIVLLTRRVPDVWRRRTLATLAVVSWPAALALGWFTATTARHDLFVAYAGDPHDGLLERVTQSDRGARDGVVYLARNDLAMNLFSEWKVAGDVLFHAPHVRVFIDGRSQQVYDEETFAAYEELVTNDADADPARLLRLLDGGSGDGGSRHAARTDGVLLGHNLGFQLTRILMAAPAWRPVYLSRRTVLFVRRDSDAFREIARRVRDGTEWRPDEPGARLTRGDVLAAMDPPDPAAALAEYQRAVAADVLLAQSAYPRIEAMYRQLGETAAARTFLDAERNRLRQKGPALAEVPEPVRQRFLAWLDGWESRLDATGPD
jgi:hypothetical protein